MRLTASSRLSARGIKGSAALVYGSFGVCRSTRAGLGGAPTGSGVAVEGVHLLVPQPPTYIEDRGGRGGRGRKAGGGEWATPVGGAPNSWRGLEGGKVCVDTQREKRANIALYKVKITKSPKAIARVKQRAGNRALESKGGAPDACDAVVEGGREAKCEGVVVRG